MNIIFWGGTGQAKVLREALAGRAELLAVFDRRALASPFTDVPLYVGEAGLEQWLHERGGSQGLHAAVAIGGARGRDRLARMEQLSTRGFAVPEIIHPRAFVAADVRRGQGCQILALAAVCTCAVLGRGVIVNTRASVDHDCVIGDGAHIGPGAVLTGEVYVEAGAFIGAGAVVLPGRRIGADALVGAGAVVTRDVAAAGVVAGNPARPHSKA